MNRTNEIAASRMTSPPMLLVWLVLAGCAGRPAPAQSSGPAPMALPEKPAPSLSPAAGKAPALAEAHAPEGPATRLRNGFPSVEALAEAILAAVTMKDDQTLLDMRVTPLEYAEEVFPEFILHAPVNLEEIEFYWMTLDLESHAGIQEGLGKYGGKDYELIEVVPALGIEEYASYRMLRKVDIRACRVEDGSEITLKFLGPIVEMDGSFKVLAFRH